MLYTHRQEIRDMRYRIRCITTDGATAYAANLSSLTEDKARAGVWANARYADAAASIFSKRFDVVTAEREEVTR